MLIPIHSKYLHLNHPILSVWVYLSINSKYGVKLTGYEDKINATKNMNACINGIREIVPFNIEKYDRYNTGLIGVDSSRITTKFDHDSSMLISKMIVTHPNFAAYIVDKFYELGIKENNARLHGHYFMKSNQLARY